MRNPGHADVMLLGLVTTTSIMGPLILLYLMIIAFKHILMPLTEKKSAHVWFSGLAVTGEFLEHMPL